MADFEQAVEKTLKLEGGYSNQTGDYGGETKYGVSKRWHPEVDIKLLTVEGAKEILKLGYWDKLSLDKVQNQAIAEELFDTAVNLSWMDAGKFLQGALNLLVSDDYLKVDGLVGPRTLIAVNKYEHTEAILKTLNGLQFMHYWTEASEDEMQRQNFRGWLKRVEFNGG